MIPGQDSDRTDVLTQEQRRRCMSANKGRDTRPELRLRRRLWGMGFRYRIGHSLPGKPDIVFVSRRVAVFVDGCFWHRCPEHFHMPRTNREFWENKIARNVARDAAVTGQLTAAGWRVVRIWEHEVRQDCDGVAERIAAVLRED
jgi:DNA mismatch endonuclease (patch repair protein)